MTRTTKKSGFYRDLAGKWRWRIVNPDNHVLVSASSQGFASRAIAVENARLTRDGLLLLADARPTSIN